MGPITVCLALSAAISDSLCRLEHEKHSWVMDSDVHFASCLESDKREACGFEHFRSQNSVLTQELLSNV